MFIAVTAFAIESSTIHAAISIEIRSTQSTFHHRGIKFQISCRHIACKYRWSTPVPGSVGLFGDSEPVETEDSGVDTWLGSTKAGYV